MINRLHGSLPLGASIEKRQIECAPKCRFSIFVSICVAVGIGFDDRVDVEHLTGIGQCNLAIEGDAQMIANRILGAIFNVGIHNDLFTNGKRAVAGVRDLHKAPFIDDLDHLARKIRVFGVKRRVVWFFARTNSEQASDCHTSQKNLFHHTNLLVVSNCIEYTTKMSKSK